MSIIAPGVVKSLYERLGGFDAMSSLSDDLLTRLENDAQIGVYWKGQSADSRKRSRQLMTEYLCTAFGGNCIYLGRDMKTAHGGLGIRDAEFQTFMKHAQSSLERFAIRGKDKDEFLAVFNNLKKSVVEKP